MQCSILSLTWKHYRSQAMLAKVEHSSLFDYCVRDDERKKLYDNDIIWQFPKTLYRHNLQMLLIG
jgi:hypothetical protein